MTTTQPDAIGWQQHASCAGLADAEALFSNDPVEIDKAKEMCARCPVRRQCLTFAMSIETAADTTHGIYGGLTPSERIELRRGMVTCDQCGALYTKRKRNQRYCSPGCAETAHSIRKAAWQKRNPKPPRSKHPCADCGGPAEDRSKRCDSCNRAWRSRALREAS